MHMIDKHHKISEGLIEYITILLDFIDAVSSFNA